MKNTALKILAASLIAGCSAMPAHNDTSDNQSAGSSASAESSSGTGLWRYQSQWWNKGIHFCEYSNGLNQVINRMENFEACPAEIHPK